MTTSLVLLGYIGFYASGTYVVLLYVNSSDAPALARSLGIAWYALIHVLLAMVLITAIYTFTKIVRIVFQTSSKLVKLLRTDDREKVVALRRRVFGYMSVPPVFLILGLMDSLFNSAKLAGVLSTLIYVAIIYFLDFVRAGIIKLDDWELRHQTESSYMPSVSEGAKIPSSYNPTSGKQSTDDLKKT